MGRQRIIIGIAALLFALPVTLKADELAPIDLLKKENERLRVERDEFEARVRRLQTELNDVRATLIHAKMQSDGFEHRCRTLLNELAALKGDKPRPALIPNGTTVTEIRAKPAAIQGKITSISKTSRLVQISIGNEAGLKQGQTLDVYRLAGAEAQRPLYLGTLTLVRTDALSALGEFKSVFGNDRHPVVGDEVASEFCLK